MSPDQTAGQHTAVVSQHQVSDQSLLFNSLFNLILTSVFLSQRILTCKKAGSILREARDRVVSLTTDSKARVIACHVSVGAASLRRILKCPGCSHLIILGDLSYCLFQLYHGVLMRRHPKALFLPLFRAMIQSWSSSLCCQRKRCREK